MRIAVAGFQHETNSAGLTPADLAEFEMADSWPHLLRGAEVIDTTRGMNLPIAGFIAAAHGRGDDVVPLLWASAEPSGLVTDRAFDTISDEILDGIARAGDVDGIYLDLHGAMITDSHLDGEGALLARIRARFGPELPVAISLDLHANLTAKMVDLSDIITLYKTYPHLDMADTGARAHRQLQELLQTGRPAKAFRQAPFLIPLHAQHTGPGAAADLYAALPDAPGHHVELALGFTAGDMPDTGPALVAYAQDQATADALADDHLAQLVAAERAFDAPLVAPEIAVARAIANDAPKPVVLADVQDNPGAGASSDTVGLLKHLIAAGAQKAMLGLIHDPALAAAAHAAGVGSTVRREVGGRSGVPGETPLSAQFDVVALSDGHCTYTGEMYGGGIATLGPTAALRITENGADVTIVVTSIRNQCLDLAHFTHLGLDPTRARILAVKSTAHFRADFEPIASEVIAVACPGLFPCELDPSQFRHLRPGVRIRAPRESANVT